MHVKASVVIIILFLIPSFLYGGSFEGKVVGISDGDIIKVLKDGKQVRVRLAAIDCPEKDQPYGQRAKQFTADMVAGKVAKVWEANIDR